MKFKPITLRITQKPSQIHGGKNYVYKLYRGKKLLVHGVSNSKSAIYDRMDADIQNKVR